MTERISNTAQSTVASGLNNTTDPVTFTVDDASTFPPAGNFRLLAGSEILLVTAVSGASFTASRAQENTAAAAHVDGTVVTLVFTAASFPLLVAAYLEHGAKVYRATAQSVPDAAETAVAFPSEAWDSDGMHDAVTNNDRLTCQEAGKYMVVLNATYGAPPGGTTFEAAIKSQSGAYLARTQVFADDVTVRASVVALVDMAAADWVQAVVTQVSGSAQDLAGGADNISFAAQRLA